MKKLLLNPTFNPNELLEYMRKNEKEVSIVNNKIEISLDGWTEAKTKDIPPPEVTFTQMAFIKMTNLVATNSKEVAWHGLVAKQENAYVIYDILVYPQKIAATTVDADEKEYTQWLMRRHEYISDIRMQGHSHVNMPVSPSGTDTKYYAELVSQVEDYYIFIIINKTWDMYIRFYDVTNGIMYTDLPIEVLDMDLSFFEEQSKTQFNESKSIVPTNVYGYGGIKNEPK